MQDRRTPVPMPAAPVDVGRAAFVRDSLRGRTARWPLAVVRVWLGAILVRSSLPKLEAAGDWPRRMIGFLSMQAGNTFAGYRAVVQQVIVPHAALFGALTAVGELTLGVLLVAGLATRAAAGLALFMVLNYELAKGGNLLAPTNNDLLFMLGLFAVLATAAGRSFGIDHWLHRRSPGAWLW